MSMKLALLFSAIVSSHGLQLQQQQQVHEMKTKNNQIVRQPEQFQLFPSPPSKNHRIGIVSGFTCDGDLDSAENNNKCNHPLRKTIREYGIRNRKEYAEKHGWGVHFEESTLATGKLIEPEFNKLLMIRKYLPQYDWLLWMDDDAMFLDMEPDYSQCYNLAKENHHLILSRDGVLNRTFPDDHRSLNSGVMWLRSSPWMLQFIDELLMIGEGSTEFNTLISTRASKNPNHERHHLHTATSGEQDFIGLVLKAHNWLDKVAPLSVSMQAIVREDAGKFKENYMRGEVKPMAVHFAGCFSNAEQCEAAFKLLTGFMKEPKLGKSSCPIERHWSKGAAFDKSAAGTQLKSEAACLQKEHIKKHVDAISEKPSFSQLMREGIDSAFKLVRSSCPPVKFIEPMRVRDDLGKMLNQLGLHGVGVEVGVQRGLYTKALLENWRNASLYVQVDLWEQQDNYNDIANKPKNTQQTYMQESCSSAELMKQKGYVSEVVQCKDFSTECVKHFPDSSIDFVYIDARHDRQGVLEDLQAYWPKIKNGGVIAGHDYMEQFEVALRGNQDWSINGDGSRDESGRVVRGAVNDFFSGVLPDAPKDLQDCPRQPVITYREGKYNTWVVRK